MGLFDVKKIEIFHPKEKTELPELEFIKKTPPYPTQLEKVEIKEESHIHDYEIIEQRKTDGVIIIFCKRCADVKTINYKILKEK